MSRIIQILIKNHVFFLFIILQFISFKILINHNLIIESGFSKISTEISGFIFEKQTNIKEYFWLKETNTELLKEQKMLLEEIENLKKLTSLNDSLLNDSTENQSTIIQAKIVKNTWRKKNNFIIINSGSTSNITPNLGVVNNNNLIGMTYTISENFSTIISLLNTDFTVSAKIKHSGHYGSLSWDGNNFQLIELNDIPKHAKINIGDTIVTSGYSNTFPENINVGVIEKCLIEEKTNFLTISVRLFADFTSIKHAYVLKSNLKEERVLIEKTLLN